MSSCAERRNSKQVYVEQGPPSPYTPGPQPLSDTLQKTMSVLARNLKDISEDWVVSFYRKGCWLHKRLLNDRSKV